MARKCYSNSLSHKPTALINDESADIDPAAWPSTINEAATRIVANLSPQERADLASWNEDDLMAQHFGMGIQIRNNFGLWGENTKLLDDCTMSSGQATGQIENDEFDTEMLLCVGRMNADGASEIILRAARDLARSLGV